MSKTILIIDDKPHIILLVKDYLTEVGFRVVSANNGRDGLFVARHEKPDLILLDIMMPELDGFEFMQIHRKESETPIILITAIQEETNKVYGLELGADDYVTKPFGMAELTARIRAVLRRVYKEAVSADVMRLGVISIDKSQHSVMVNDTPVELTPTEFKLLIALMSSPGRVFTRSELLEHLQKGWVEAVERTVDVHIRNLRAKIERCPGSPKCIETVFGMGYRCVVEA